MEDALSLVLFNAYDTAGISLVDMCALRSTSHKCNKAVQEHFNYLRERWIQNTIFYRPFKFYSYCFKEPCKYCGMRATTRGYPLHTSNPRICNTCLTRNTISQEQVVKRWKTPLIILSKIASLEPIPPKLLYDKEQVRKAAIEYHGGLRNTLIACEGKAKHKRYTTLMALSADLPKKTQFLKTEHAKRYLANGFPGLKKFKTILEQWKCFIESINNLPGNIKNIARISWFDEDPSTDVHEKVLQLKAEQKRKLEVSRYPRDIWREAEAFTYIITGDSNIKSQVDDRIECYQQIPTHLRKYVIEFMPEYLYDIKPISVPACNIINRLEIYAFLVNETTFRYYYKRFLNQTTNNNNMAQAQALIKTISQLATSKESLNKLSILLSK